MTTVKKKKKIKEGRGSTRTSTAMASRSLLRFIFLVFTAIHVQPGAPTDSLSSCLLSMNVKNFTTLGLSSPSAAGKASPFLYNELLNVSIRNLRFTGPAIPKPVAIILPETKHHLRSAVICCLRTAVAIRIRSGGHSYEGLSSVGDWGKPFAIIDLMKLNKVNVDLPSGTAWVESGATLGEIYHAVAESSRTLTFPAGSCPTVGSGGHIAGGGFGFLSRRYGLAADNVIDALLVSPEGRVLDRRSMGDNVFWAIRGGGGGSWGAVYAWRVRLVPVPEKVTAFVVSRRGTSRHVAKLVHTWQHVAPWLPDEFFLSVTLQGNANGNFSASFLGLFLGRRGEAMSTMRQQFPELGLVELDCVEMSWIDAVVFFAGLKSVAELRDRVPHSSSYFKAKSDYVRAPITTEGLVGALDWMAREHTAYVIFDPYGGAMGRIRSDHLPFPHRIGNIYGVQYVVSWTVDDDWRRDEYMDWIRGLYRYMAPWVSSNPRAAYVNYLDLDLGTSGSTVDEARVWGTKYFLGNFDRLVRAKTTIDPKNVFKNAQSIVPLSRRGA